MNKIKKSVLLSILILSFLSPAAAYADESPTATPSVTVTPGNLHGGFKGIRQAVRKDIKDDRHDLKQDIKNLIPLFKNVANITGGQVTAVNGSSFTISKDGKTYTVNTDSNTKFRRRFWGGSSLSEITVNDKVNVWGTWTDDNKTAINAKLVRDVSIQKRNGVFFGQVTSLGSNTFVMSTIGRGNQTVTVSSSTKFINISGGTIAFADLKTGDRVRIRGLWDRVANTITEVKEIKDFGPKPTSTPTPTP